MRDTARDELKSDVLLWIPSHGRAKARRPAQTYIQQLCADTGCSPEGLLEAIDDRKGGERGSGISMLMAWHDDDDDEMNGKKDWRVGLSENENINTCAGIHVVSCLTCSTDIVVIEFDLKSRNYDHFWLIPLEKEWTNLSP